MNTKNIILTLLSIVAFVAFVTPKAYADVCTTQYGGETTCVPSDLTINKQVRSANGNTFVENVSASDPTFAPGSEVLYKLIIKNSSGETFNPVYVKDVLPSYLTFVSGPGTYDSATRTLTFELKEVYAGETRTIEVMARVASTDYFNGKSFVCFTNYAEVRALNRFDSDTAQICLQNKVLGVTTLPVAGFNDLTVLLPFAGVGLAGFALLRRK